ncbi:MAG: Maf family protein, partial [Armatimonadetes bacterium]|nr:Maf family protein [Armatimonadota bacterium]
RSKILAASKNLPNSWLIAADTIVVAGRKPLGKPKSEKEAKKMLKQLSGRTHLYVTLPLFNPLSLLFLFGLNMRLKQKETDSSNENAAFKRCKQKTLMH